MRRPSRIGRPASVRASSPSQTARHPPLAAAHADACSMPQASRQRGWPHGMIRIAADPGVGATAMPYPSTPGPFVLDHGHPNVEATGHRDREVRVEASSEPVYGSPDAVVLVLFRHL